VELNHRRVAQGRTDGSGQAVENVGTQGSVSRQEITELLSRDSRTGNSRKTLTPKLNPQL
jgi:hypothetical protein